MAENQEDRSRDDLTEEASPYRLEEFRRRGMVAQSRELTGLAAILAAAVALYASSPDMGRRLGEFMQEVFRADLSSRLELGASGVVRALMLKALGVTAWLSLPACVAAAVVGSIASFAQVGSIFSTDPLTPDLSRINPLSGLGRIFSLKQGVEAIRLLAKIGVIFAICWYLIKAEVFRSPMRVFLEPQAALLDFGQAAKTMFFSLFAALTLFALIDFGIQRWEYTQKLRMTKQEARQEHKEREGDPQIKARIRAVQREVARRRMMQAVKKADAIVTNPTHIAIAIQYDRENMLAPKVVAKGADLIAKRIREIAQEAGVPIVENVPLARALFKSVKVNQYVPRALYQAVAEVLAYVYRLRGRYR